MEQIPGKGKATASMILGIIAVVFWFLGIFAFIGVILSIIGLVLSSMAKKEGFRGGMQTAGFVLSLIALIGGTIWTIIALVGIVAAVGMRLF